MKALGLFDAMGAGLFGINLARFHALPDGDILALHKAGALGIIYAHFVSMTHMAWMQRPDDAPKRAALPAQKDTDLSRFLTALNAETPYQNTVLAGLLNGQSETLDPIS
jgi:hypothetical protein